MTDGPPTAAAKPDANVSLQLSLTAAPAQPPPPPPADAKPRSWLTPVTAPIFVAILALVAPLTTAINAHFQSRLQLELDRQKQADERTRLYLERAISQDAGAESRQQVLRFLEIQGADLDLRTWAAAELADLRVEVPTLQAAEQSLTEEVVATQQTVADLSHQQDQIQQQIARAAEPARENLKKELAEVNQKLDRERIDVAAKTDKLTRVSRRLRGPKTVDVAAMTAVAVVPPARCSTAALLEQPAPAGATDIQCMRSVVAGAPPTDATLLAGRQWRWQLPTGATCVCFTAP